MAKKIVKNAKELETQMQKVLENGVTYVGKIIHEIIVKYINQWYSEYSPSVYNRTYQLLEYCTLGKLTKTGKNKVSLEIYMDYAHMTHVSYWPFNKSERKKRKQGKRVVPRVNRRKTTEEELLVLRMANGQDLRTGARLSDSMVHRGFGSPEDSGTSLRESKVMTGKMIGQPTRFWEDSVDEMENNSVIITSFIDYLAKEGFNVLIVYADTGDGGVAF